MAGSNAFPSNPEWNLQDKLPGKPRAEGRVELAQGGRRRIAPLAQPVLHFPFLGLEAALPELVHDEGVFRAKRRELPGGLLP
jgi:hypothetical protein